MAARPKRPVPAGSDDLDTLRLLGSSSSRIVARPPTLLSVTTDLSSGSSCSSCSSSSSSEGEPESDNSTPVPTPAGESTPRSTQTAVHNLPPSRPVPLPPREGIEEPSLNLSPKDQPKRRPRKPSASSSFDLRKWRTGSASAFQQLIEASGQDECFSAFDIVSCIAASQECSRTMAIELAGFLLVAGDIVLARDDRNLRERRRTEAKIQLPEINSVSVKVRDFGTQKRRNTSASMPAVSSNGQQVKFEDSDDLHFSFNPSFVQAPRRRLNHLERSQEKVAKQLGTNSSLAPSPTKRKNSGSPLPGVPSSSGGGSVFSSSPPSGSLSASGSPLASKKRPTALITAASAEEKQMQYLDLSCGRCRASSAVKCVQCDIALCDACSARVHDGKWQSHKLEPVEQSDPSVLQLRTLPSLAKTARLMEAPRVGVKTRAKMLGLHRFRRVCSAEDIVDWMLSHLPMRNRAEATELGQSLVSAGLIESIGGKGKDEPEFADTSEILYRFTNGRSLRKRGLQRSGGSDAHPREDWQATLRQKVSLADFDLIRILGKGGFGKVLEARRKTDGKVFAIKIIQKQVVSRSAKRLADVAHERAIMQNDHAFLIHLHYAFQTDDRIFFVMDYLPGGDLWYHLRDARDGLPVQTVQFLVGEMVLALEYLHSKNIVYRDLKPENVLVDEDGHVCLCDFGISKQLQDDSDRTHSIVGTTCFMAPEVIQGANYGVKVDWWSLGVMMYHLISGRHPFFANDKQTIIQKVLRKVIVMPANFASLVGFDLITHMMDRDAAARYGHAQIKAHPFFAGIDWTKMALKKLQPPFEIAIDGPHELTSLPAGEQSEPLFSDAALDSKNVTGSIETDDELYFPSFTYVSPNAY